MATVERSIAAESIDTTPSPAVQDGAEDNPNSRKTSQIEEGNENLRPVQRKGTADVQTKRRTSDSGANGSRRLPTLPKYRQTYSASQPRNARL